MSEANHSRELLDALRGIMRLIDGGELVRDISRDGEPDWSLRMICLVSTLKAASDAIAKAEGRS